MFEAWPMLIIAWIVLLGACLVVGFLAGIACWQEREARRIRRERRDRRRAPEERVYGSDRRR